MTWEDKHQGFIGLLYLLMRDDVTSGAMERCVTDIESSMKKHSKYKFSNKHLENHAKEIIRRLEK